VAEELIQIVDAAMAEAGRRAGAWLACRPGCCDCCRGAFEISRLDAARLRRGLADLQAREPARAARVGQRAASAAARLRREYPGNTAYRVLHEAPDDDEPCPVLDPATGTCDLYHARPLACRTFGPAVQTAGAVAVCELCFTGATENEIAACAVELDVDALELPLLQQSEDEVPSPSLVALAFDQ